MSGQPEDLAMEQEGLEESVLRQRLRFQQLICDVSNHFINLPVEEIDQHIKEALGKLASFLGFNGATITKFAVYGKAGRIGHIWTAADVPPVLETFTEKDFPWSAECILEGKEVMLPALDSLPPAASVDRATLERYDARSVYNIALRSAGVVVGVLGLVSLGRTHPFPEELRDEIDLFAEVLANALARQRAATTISEALAFERMLTDFSRRLLAATPSSTAGEVERELHALADFFGVDRCIFWELSEGQTRFTILHSYHEEPDLVPGSVETNELPWFMQELSAGRSICLERLSDLPATATGERRYWAKHNLKSALLVPLVAFGRLAGCLSLAAVKAERQWPPDLVRRLQLAGELITNAMIRKDADEALLNSYAEIKDLKHRLQAECEYLKEEIKVTQSHGEVVGESPLIRKVLHQVEQVASTDSSVLICGETGTGKELIANAIHRASLRKAHIMVVVNCAALPAGLVESELFGRERGAYTGALTRQAGRFEVADRSTLFLDEIGELSLELQAKLLRVLERGEFERLGSPRTIKVNVRLIAATNRDLGQAVAEGKFREDLFYRLNVFPITIPPLRERLEDIPELVWAFVREFAQRMGKKITKIPLKAMETLQGYHWPGNVRQLRNIVEHSVIVSPGEALKLAMAEDLSVGISRIAPLANRERDHILRALQITQWRIKGPKGAAAKLGLKPSTLYSRMEKLNIPTRRERRGLQ